MSFENDDRQLRMDAQDNNNIETIKYPQADDGQDDAETSRSGSESGLSAENEIYIEANANKADAQKRQETAAAAFLRHNENGAAEKAASKAQTGTQSNAKLQNEAQRELQSRLRSSGQKRRKAFGSKSSFGAPISRRPGAEQGTNALPNTAALSPASRRRERLGEIEEPAKVLSADDGAVGKFTWPGPKNQTSLRPTSPPPRTQDGNSFFSGPKGSDSPEKTAVLNSGRRDGGVNKHSGPQINQTAQAKSGADNAPLTSESVQADKTGRAGQSNIQSAAAKRQSGLGSSVKDVLKRSDANAPFELKEDFLFADLIKSEPAEGENQYTRINVQPASRTDRRKINASLDAEPQKPDSDGQSRQNGVPKDAISQNSSQNGQNGVPKDAISQNSSQNGQDGSRNNQSGQNGRNGQNSRKNSERKDLSGEISVQNPPGRDDSSGRDASRRESGKAPSRVLTAIIEKPQILLETPYSVLTKSGPHLRYRLEYGYPDAKIPEQEQSIPGQEYSPLELEAMNNSAPIADGSKARPVKKRKSLGREIFNWVKVLAAALILALIIRQFVFVLVWVEGSSMEPTLMNQERIIVTRYDYIFGEPQRQDIVICHFPDGDNKDNYVKRIIGLPGERIKIDDGTVYINGQPLEEPYVVYEKIQDMEEITIPEDMYFLMGDNRFNSRDSRVVGLIERSQIQGHVRYVFYPFEDRRSVDYSPQE